MFIISVVFFKKSRKFLKNLQYYKICRLFLFFVFLRTREKNYRVF